MDATNLAETLNFIVSFLEAGYPAAHQSLLEEIESKLDAVGGAPSTNEQTADDEEISELLAASLGPATSPW
jgi:hypothetical protein